MRMRTANNPYVGILVICVLWSPARTSGQLKPPDDSSQGPLVLAVKAADPFDVETGIYSREYADLFVKDSVPIEFSRQKGDWTVALRDGTELTVQGCNASSKPGQCALSEIKNAKGERLTVQRDKDGNILRVTSPHGHYVSVANDSAGHITRAETDSHQWVEYGYDGKGCLIRARNWRGDKQTFAYDSQFNMTFVHEKGPRTSGSEAYDFTITNSYDGQNRLKRQKISTGEVYWAQYITDAKNHTRETVVGNPSGRTRYFFNQAGYVIREEFRAANGAAWTLEQARNPNSNSTVRATLHCATGKTDLPLGQNSPLELNGKSEIAYFTRTCELIEKKRELQEKRASGNDP